MCEQTYIKGKDAALEESIASMQQKLVALNIEVEEASWLNPIPNVFSVHIRDTDCELMFTNGKGSTDKSCLASAIGEYFERLSCNYFFADFYLGKRPMILSKPWKMPMLSSLSNLEIGIHRRAHLN